MNPTMDTDHLLQQARDAFAAGDFAGAFASAGKALTQTPPSEEARMIRINAALKLERWQDAISALETLLRSQPQQMKLSRILATCWLRVGHQHKAQGKIEAAADAYRKALKADAGNLDVRYSLGALELERGRADSAMELLRPVVDAQPSDTSAALKLAQAQIAVGRNAEAAELLNRVAKQPASAEHLQHCSQLLLKSGSLDAAKAVARKLIGEQQDIAAWTHKFCRQLREHNDLAGSRELLALLRQRTADPVEHLRIDLADALGLPATYPDRMALETTRRDFIARLERFTTAYPATIIATIAPQPEALLWDNFFLAYQGENDREPQGRFGKWLSASLRAVLPELAQPSRTHRSRPRLAMVSSRFHECTVGSYFASWVEYLAGHGWELILVHVGSQRDHLTERLAKCVQGELTLDASIAENAQKLRELDADLILYPELGMDHRTLALAALRLAPCQVCAWGHPVTSGLPTIDVFLSCAQMEPDDAADHYSERLLSLPGLGTRYLSPEIPDAVSRKALGLPERGVLYLVPQSLFKLHPDNDSIFVDILRQDPEAVLLFFRGVEDGPRHTFVERLSEAMRHAGITLEDRVLFLPMRSRNDYLRINLACDVMIDSLHWSGGNTSLDALHAGLPVVTCPGRFMRGRQSMAMLQQLDCAELIAASAEKLARLAIDIAHDRVRRAKIGARISANLDTLTRSDAPLQALDAALNRIVAESWLQQ